MDTVTETPERRVLRAVAAWYRLKRMEREVVIGGRTWTKLDARWESAMNALSADEEAMYYERLRANR